MIWPTDVLRISTVCYHPKSAPFVKSENSGYVTNTRSVVDGGFARIEIWRCSR